MARKLSWFVALVAAVMTVGAAAAPAAQIPSHARTDRAPETGVINFVGTEPGRPMARPEGVGPNARPAAAGAAFLDEHRAELGVPEAARLRPTRTVRTGRGAAVRFQQSYDGIDVLGGEISVQLDADNNVLSVLGEAEPTAGVETSPGIDRSAAEAAAVRHVAREEQVHAARLDVADAELKIFDNRIVGGPGPHRPVLVWAVRVQDDLVVRRLVLVAARRGIVVASIDESPEARNRSVCDANNASLHVPCNSPVITEATPDAPVGPDARAAFDYSGATYDFLSSRFGRDSLDGAGMPLKATVRYCEPGEPCPFENAFWNGEQVVYGDDFALADDVVGHELAHGLTEHTSNLLYYFQSGAINESLSDVFGELVDQATPSPDDDVADKWLLAETLGAFRDMRDPTAGPYFDPDRMTSANWNLDPNLDDSGGVHSNSGVGNKAAYLITDGDSFNGQTVTGIGPQKAGRLYYTVTTQFLTSGSDYRDLGNALVQACDNLVGSHDFVAGDCDQVRKAVQATEMLVDRPEARDDAVCPVGQQPTDVLADNLENNATRWGTTGRGWFVDSFYATSGVTSLYAQDEGDAQATAELISALTIPSGAYLRFNHAFHFTPGGDAAVVDVNSGSGWVDALPADRYSGTLPAIRGNPLSGRRAFFGVSAGYRTTAAPLPAAATGRSGRIRFRIGTDSSSDGGFWNIDDIAIYTCATPAFNVDPASAFATESGGSSILVTRTGGTGDASVQLTTSGGSATPGADYEPLSTTVRFTGAQTSVRIPLNVIDDAAVDGGETIGYAIAAPTNGALGATTSGTLTIADNDVAPDVLNPVPAKPVLKVIRARAFARRITLRVAVPAAGKLTVTGRAGRLKLKPAKARTTRARTVTIGFKISARLKRLLRRRAVRAAFTARFRPAAGGATLTATKTLKLKRRR